MLQQDQHHEYTAQSTQEGQLCQCPGVNKSPEQLRRNLVVELSTATPHPARWNWGGYAERNHRTCPAPAIKSCWAQSHEDIRQKTGGWDRCPCSRTTPKPKTGSQNCPIGPDGARVMTCADPPCAPRLCAASPCACKHQLECESLFGWDARGLRPHVE